jgi:hypothetical protein
VIELQVQHAFSLSYSSQGEAHAARSLVGVKRHAAVALESAPRGGRLDAHPGEIRFAKAAGRVRFDSGEKLVD